jgi:hypothetical protein
MPFDLTVLTPSQLALLNEQQILAEIYHLIATISLLVIVLILFMHIAKFLMWVLPKWYK